MEGLDRSVFQPRQKKLSPPLQYISPIFSFFNSIVEGWGFMIIYNFPLCLYFMIIYNFLRFKSPYDLKKNVEVGEMQLQWDAELEERSPKEKAKTTSKISKLNEIYMYKTPW